MMYSLFGKYRNNRISVEELHRLRDYLNSVGDDELLEILDRCDPESPDLTQIELSDEAMARMRQRCFVKAGIISPYRKWMRAALLAGAVMLPLLMASTVFLFVEARDYKTMASTDITIKTGPGEHVTTNLPDGTQVELNYQSLLSYNNLSFSNSTRRVRFSGEAFFDVVKKQNAPFVIASNGFEVTVKGTSFNLQARTESKHAELYLHEGLVDLRSARQTVHMKAGQLAVLDYKTGAIKITDTDSTRYMSWRTGDLLFHNETLQHVVATLSSNYNYAIEINAPLTGRTGRFTGRMPSNNLNEALTIIECTYHLQAHVSGRTVSLTEE